MFFCKKSLCSPRFSLHVPHITYSTIIILISILPLVSFPTLKRNLTGILNALKPEDFVTLLEDSVNRYFDEAIYDEVMADPKHSADSIRRLLQKSIKKFSEYEKAYTNKIKDLKYYNG